MLEITKILVDDDRNLLVLETDDEMLVMPMNVSEVIKKEKKEKKAKKQ